MTLAPFWRLLVNLNRCYFQSLALSLSLPAWFFFSAKAQKRTRAALRKGCEDLSEPRSPESLPEKKKGKGRGRGGRGKAKMKRPAAAHAPEPPAKKGKTGKGEEKEKEDEEEAGQEDESDMQGQSTSKAGNNKRKGKQPGRKKEEPQEEEQENPEEEEQEEQQEEEQENPEEEEEQTEEDVGTSPKLEPQAAGYLLRRPFVVLALAYNRFVFFGLSASLYLSLSPLFNRSCTCQVERGLKEMRAIAAKDKRFLVAEQEILNGSRPDP